MNESIVLHHNFDGKQFKWLYAKYSTGVNPNHHCTYAIKGKYSKRFNRNNSSFSPNNDIILDEFPELGWDAIYICGVSSKGYRRHENYPHNVHIAILPSPGKTDYWSFENWEMTVKNGVFEYVIDEKQLDARFKNLPKEYVTCRMFRWAVSHYKKRIAEMTEDEFYKTFYNS